MTKNYKTFGYFKYLTAVQNDAKLNRLTTIDRKVRNDPKLPPLTPLFKCPRQRKNTVIFALRRKIRNDLKLSIKQRLWQTVHVNVFPLYRARMRDGLQRSAKLFHRSSMRVRPG